MAGIADGFPVGVIEPVHALAPKVPQTATPAGCGADQANSQGWTAWLRDSKARISSA
jgi:hypothetical protein